MSREDLMSDILPDPQNSPALKAAKIAVIILSSLIILALIALVVGAVMKLSGGKKPPTAEPPSNFTLAPGSAIFPAPVSSNCWAKAASPTMARR